MTERRRLRVFLVSSTNAIVCGSLLLFRDAHPLAWAGVACGVLGAVMAVARPFAVGEDR